LLFNYCFISWCRFLVRSSPRIVNIRFAGRGSSFVGCGSAARLIEKRLALKWKNKVAGSGHPDRHAASSRQIVLVSGLWKRVRIQAAGGLGERQATRHRKHK